MQSVRAAVTGFVLSCAFTALATAPPPPRPVIVRPSSPTSAEPIEVHVAVPCVDANATVERTGNVIRLGIAGGACPTPPIAVPDAFRIDPLPPGEYTIQVLLAGSSGIYAQTRFVVRPVEPQPFTVIPSVVFSAGAEVRLVLPDGASFLCVNHPQCSTTFVHFGGVRADPPVRNSDGSLTVKVPALPPGAYDVTVTTPYGDSTSRLALYFSDGSMAFSAFSRVLFPLLFDGAGAHGSQWTSEAVVLNPTSGHVTLWNLENHHHVFRFGLGPGDMRELAPEWPRGWILYGPRRETGQLAFALRVRDVSREEEGFGTEVPVVREEDLAFDTTMTLLNVPADSRYRAKLRIYALPPFLVAPAQLVARVVTLDLASGARNVTDVPLRTAGCDICFEEPAYAEFDLPMSSPMSSHGSRVNVYVEPPPGTYSWSFVSVTNNVTQQVTIVTPDGKGGVPCTTCPLP